MLKKTLSEFSDDQCTDLAAALTYYAVLALFPAAIAPLILGADLEQGSLHDTLVEGGRVPTMGRARLGAEAAGPEDALRLDVPEGSPLLVEKRVIHDQDGRPLELCESRYAGARYGLDVQFDVELPSSNGG